MDVVYSDFDEKVISSENGLFDIVGKGALPFAVCDYTALISLFTSDLLCNATWEYQKRNAGFFLLCDADVKIILKDRSLLKRYGIEEESLLDKIFERYKTAVKGNVVLVCPDRTILEPKNYPSYDYRFMLNRFKACLLADFVLRSPKDVAIESPGNQDVYTNQTNNRQSVVLLTDGRVIGLPNRDIGLVENGRQSPREVFKASRFKICSTPLLLLLFLHQQIITTDDLPLVVEQLKPLGWNDKESLPDYAVGSNRVALRSYVAPCIYHHLTNNCPCGKLIHHPNWCQKIGDLINSPVQ
jgi:hypothetical protein